MVGEQMQIANLSVNNFTHTHTNTQKKNWGVGKSFSGYFAIWMRIPDSWLLGNWEFTV
jgi:hypothetical protein